MSTKHNGIHSYQNYFKCHVSFELWAQSPVASAGANLFVTALREKMSSDHPIRRFMSPFTYRTLGVNDNAFHNLIAKGGKSLFFNWLWQQKEKKNKVDKSKTMENMSINCVASVFPIFSIWVTLKMDHFKPSFCQVWDLVASPSPSKVPSFSTGKIRAFCFKQIWWMVCNLRVVCRLCMFLMFFLKMIENCCEFRSLLKWCSMNDVFVDRQVWCVF